MLGVVEGRLRKPSMIDQSPGHPLGFVPQQKEQSPSQSLVLRLSRKEAVKTSLYILKVNFFDIKINKMEVHKHKNKQGYWRGEGPP